LNAGLDEKSDQVFEIANIGDQLEFQMSQRLEAGKSINESFSHHQYVDDDIIIKLMENIVKDFEERKVNYIIEGFPRTQKQALALLKMGVIPDKFIMLDKRDGEIIEYL
jgi:adenylate kinase